MTFAFTTEQREVLFHALSREDSAAWRLSEDVEAAIAAYGQGAGLAVGADLREQMAQVSHLTVSLRSALYPLPDVLRRSGVAAGIEGDLLTNLSRHAERIGDTLDQFMLELSEVRARIPDTGSTAGTAAEHFIHALGQVYRNRMNIRPVATAEGHFRQFLDAVVGLVGRRYSDLQELCQVLGESRLAQILESGHSYSPDR